MPSKPSSETSQARRAGAACASETDGNDRVNGAASATVASGPPWSSVRDPAGAGTPERLVGDFVRMLGCEVALLCERDGDSGGEVVCASGIDRPVAITISRRGGRRRPGSRPHRGGCFAGRALTHERPVFETLDPDRDADLLRAADPALTCALATRVQLFGRRSGRVLVAGFSTPPDDLGRAFWVADSYARLVALLGHDADALGGLLAHARRDALTGCLAYESVLSELGREIKVHRAAAAGRRERSSLFAARLRALIASGHTDRFEERLTASIGGAEWSPGLSASSCSLARTAHCSPPRPCQAASRPTARRAQSRPTVGSSRDDHRGRQAATVPALEEMLDTIGEFGSASLGLVPWEFWFCEDQLSPLWIDAARSRLIQPAGRSRETGEPMYSLTTSPERTAPMFDGNSRTARAHERRGGGSGSFRGMPGRVLAGFWRRYAASRVLGADWQSQRPAEFRRNEPVASDSSPA